MSADEDTVRIGVSMSKTVADLGKAAADRYGIGFSELLRMALFEKLSRDGVLQALKAGQGGP